MRKPSDFNRKDWERIVSALHSYCEAEEARLALLNAGEWEWSEYDHLEALTIDIEYYLAGATNDE